MDKVLQSLKHYNPEAEIKSFQNVSGHENDTFLVELESGEELVCTLCTGEEPSRSCKHEITFSKIVEEKTGIPTPKVVYSKCSGSPPFYIMVKVEGVNGQDFFEGRKGDMNPQKRVDFTENVGGLMGKLHNRFNFTSAGEIKVENGDIEVQASQSFKSYFSELLKSEVENLESAKFSDLQEEVEKAVQQALDILDNPAQNSLTHHDIRPDNMILEGTEVKAMLDWEHVTSGHPLIDYAHTEIHFTEPHLYYDVSKPEISIKKLRKKFQKAYERENSLPENFREQAEVFKFIEHIRNMNTFESYADSVGMSKKEKREEREKHKERFRKMKQRLGNKESLEIILE